MFTLKHSSLGLGLLLTSALLSTAALAEGPKVTVYKSPTCGCCTQWISHLRKDGFDVDPVDVKDLSIVKSMSGIKPEQASCHTAQVDGYVIEGHVPADDIRRLLAERPDARGLTVPGMPMGSPGMDSPNPQHYQVLLIGKDGSTQVFAEH
ncbi:MAG: DUF411 domain-containing protein [Chromatiaceae bacterium]